MSVMLEHPDLKEASTRSLVAVVVIMIASALAFTLARHRSPSCWASTPGRFRPHSMAWRRSCSCS